MAIYSSIHLKQLNMVITRLLQNHYKLLQSLQNPILYFDLYTYSMFCFF